MSDARFPEEEDKKQEFELEEIEPLLSEYELTQTSKPIPKAWMNEEYKSYFERGIGGDDLDHAQGYPFLQHVLTGEIRLLPGRNGVDPRQPFLDKYGKPFKKFVQSRERLGGLTGVVHTELAEIVGWKDELEKGLLIGGGILKGETYKIFQLRVRSLSANNKSVEYAPELLDKFKKEYENKPVPKWYAKNEDRILRRIPRDITKNLKEFFESDGLLQDKEALEKKQINKIQFVKDHSPFLEKFSNEIREKIKQRPLIQLKRIYPKSIPEELKRLLSDLDSKSMTPLAQMMSRLAKKIKSDDKITDEELKMIHWLIKEGADITKGINLNYAKENNPLEFFILFKQITENQYLDEHIKIHIESAMNVLEEAALKNALCKGKLKLLEEIDRWRPDILKKYLNTKCLPGGNTPITFSAKRIVGNKSPDQNAIDMIKWLKAKGANPLITNNKGEDYKNIMENGISANNWQSLVILSRNFPELKDAYFQIFSQELKKAMDLYATYWNSEDVLLRYSFFDSLVILRGLKLDQDLKNNIYSYILSEFMKYPLAVQQAMIEYKPGGNRFLELSDLKGNTALHLATSKGNKKLVQMLLTHGANSLTVNGEKKMASEMTSINASIKALLINAEKNEWKSIQEKALQARLSFFASEQSKISENKEESRELHKKSEADKAEAARQADHVSVLKKER